MQALELTEAAVWIGSSATFADFRIERLRAGIPQGAAAFVLIDVRGEFSLGAS